MRDGRRILDADSHQMEPADVWERYIAPEFRPRAPRLQPGGRENPGEGEPLTAAGKYPFPTPDLIAALMKGMQRFLAAREAGFSPQSRLADMNREGVDVQVLYPTVGGQLLGREFKDPALLAACCRAYNDWSAEYSATAPERLRWAAMLPFQDVRSEAHTSELQSLTNLVCRLLLGKKKITACPAYVLAARFA